jgi:hypothetical protein
MHIKKGRSNAVKLDLIFQVFHGNLLLKLEEGVVVLSPDREEP